MKHAPLFYCLIIFSFLTAQSSLALAVEKTVGPSGEPVPRFVSLKADLVNVRRGPSRDHKILWRFERIGLPVKIISEYEDWREIEDQGGERGWIFHSLLSRRRTANTLDPADKGLSFFSLYESPSKTSAAVAKVGKDVIVHIISCDGSWCQVSVNNKLSGWIGQGFLWGLFKNEPLK